MTSLYNGQFNDYMYTTGHVKNTDGKWIKTSEPTLSDEQKIILRKKKEILSEVDPLIELYVGYAGTGTIPEASLETEIVQLLNRLLAP